MALEKDSIAIQENAKERRYKPDFDDSALSKPTLEIEYCVS